MIVTNVKNSTEVLVIDPPEEVALRIYFRTKTEKTSANIARLIVLARRAARYAKDPVANAADQLSSRLMHEFFARLALAEQADD